MNLLHSDRCLTFTAVTASIVQLVQAEPSVAGARRFDFDQNLAPYNLHAYQQWQSLSNYISKDVISQLAPLPSGNISITAEADPAHLKPVTPAEKKMYAQLQAGHGEAASSGGSLNPMQSGHIYIPRWLVFCGWETGQH